MKLNRVACVLLVFLFAAQLWASPKKIRGTIIGYIFNAQLFVKTDEGKYFILYPQTSQMNPLPQFVLQKKIVWSFSVKPLKNCQVPFGTFRWSLTGPTCDVGEPINAPREPASFVASYPFLMLTDPTYQKDFDAINDEEILPCFAIDLEKTNPKFKQRTITGVVLGEENVPIPDFPVSIGFEGEKTGYLFVMTDQDGKFSIPVYQKFSYWIKPGRTGFEGQREYKAVRIRKNTVTKPLQLKLEYE